MTEPIEIPQLEASESDVEPVHGSKNFDFSVSLSEHLGKATIHWSTGGYPGLLRIAVAIYEGPIPPNPYNWITATEVTKRNAGSWNTDQTWGTGYSASLLGVNMASAAWINIGVNTPVTA